MEFGVVEGFRGIRECALFLSFSALLTSLRGGRRNLGVVTRLISMVLSSSELPACFLIYSLLWIDREAQLLAS